MRNKNKEGTNVTQHAIAVGAEAILYETVNTPGVYKITDEQDVTDVTDAEDHELTELVLTMSQCLWRQMDIPLQLQLSLTFI